VAGRTDVSRRRARVRGLPGAEDVVRCYGGRVEARARWSLRQLGVAARADQVEDVVQEVYCRLLDGGGRRLSACHAESEGQAVSYLARVVERVVIDQVRKRLAAKRGAGRTVASAGPQAKRLLERKEDPAGTPEDRLLAAERRRLVLAHWRDIGSAPQGRRNLRILRLALIEGWSSREIARTLGKLAPSSVDSVVHRLRRRLSEEGVALPRRPPRFTDLR
jgi:RNA polymerase sigma factor (sigma-70 family)